MTAAYRSQKRQGAVHQDVGLAEEGELGGGALGEEVVEGIAGVGPDGEAVGVGELGQLEAGLRLGEGLAAGEGEAVGEGVG